MCPHISGMIISGARRGKPEELALILKHRLVSDHRQRVWGFPKRPKTPEASIPHSPFVGDSIIPDFAIILGCSRFKR